MSIIKTITKGTGKVRAKVEVEDRYGDCLSVQSNGWQWTGIYIDKESARNIIYVLEKYIEEV